jgi:hypothetical protein
MTPHYSLATLIVCAVAACSPGPGNAVPETRSEKQMLGLMEKFDRWDYNGDGELSSREIDAGILSIKGSDKAVTYRSKDVVRHYDTNDDKTVSLREAQAGYHRTTLDDAPALPQRAKIYKPAP